MTPRELEQLATDLHNDWQAATGRRQPLTLGLSYQWEAWSQQIAAALQRSDWPQVTPRELLTVVLRYRTDQSRGKAALWYRWTACSKIVTDPDACLEDFATVRHQQRHAAPPRTDRARVLAATGRPDPAAAAQSATAPTARSAQDLLAGEAALRALLALRDGPPEPPKPS